MRHDDGYIYTQEPTNTISGKDTRGVKLMDDAIEKFNAEIKRLKITPKVKQAIKDECDLCEWVEKLEKENFNLKETLGDLKWKNGDLKLRMIKRGNMIVAHKKEIKELKIALNRESELKIKAMLLCRKNLKELAELQDKYDAIKHLLDPDRVREHEYIQKREQEDKEKK